MTLSWPRAAATRVSPLLLALALFVLQIALTYPGELITDSREQLQQALDHQFLDWHPPIMALVWSWLLQISGAPGLLLVLHQGLHWLGFGLIADGFARARMPGRALIVLLAGAFPVFLFYDREIVKDVGMGSGLVAAFGLVFWFLVQGRRIPWWTWLLSGVCIAYATLIRTNAIFAIGPMLGLYFAAGRRARLLSMVGWSAIVALVALPLSNWINHDLIGAKPQDPLRSLQLFDLMGIAVHSGDDTVLGDKPPPRAQIVSCYTAYWWDTYSPWGICDYVSAQLDYVVNDLYAVTPNMAERSTLWRRAILKHPVAYLAHRLSHFNSSIYFIVPSVTYRYSKAPEILNGQRVTTPRDLLLDYFKKNFLFWPVFWLALGAAALTLLSQARESTATSDSARALITSGLLYSGAYFFVSVATETRYYYWSIMAIMLGVIVGYTEIARQMQASPLLRRAAIALVAIVLVAGLAARIADIPLI